MAKSTITNGQDGASVRSALNTMFDDLYIRHPGYIAGNWYMPFGHVSAAGVSLGANSIRCVPFFLPQPVTITNMGVRISTLSAGGNIKVAIYANNAATGRPTGSALASTGNMATDTATIVSAAIAETSVAFTPGIYWMCSWADNATVICRSQSGASGMVPQLIGTTTEANANTAITSTSLTIASAQTYGAWPSLTAASFTEATTASHATIHFKAA
jgi:hypothetical protein